MTYFRDFGYKQCVLRKPAVRRSGYVAPASGPDGYAIPHPSGYNGPASGPDGYADTHPSGYSGPAPASGPDGYANSYVTTFEKCEGDDCTWWIKEAHSKCFGKVQLYKSFSVCGTECG